MSLLQTRDAVQRASQSCRRLPAGPLAFAALLCLPAAAARPTA